ncbi:hypothetical protein I8752_10290 [Nostocaceae cyanobacterium CENA369]|uniref:HMA domain-containing protein n=1 Tax=Dendronalium phyllosphericum CENA369 TaxID=1725256 RepID=A0A8J7I5J8_9NOST|nr:hypothetical protein [Dendronalium phyllosphericum]MBH8573396.1 hypothetical protein [Dendronalium phyllosphericum CENA369]
MMTNSHGNVTKMPKVMEQATLNKPSQAILTKIVSDTPGRLRLRVARCHRQPEQMQRIARALEAQPNISQVRTNISHGSIVINHDGKDRSLENVVGTLVDLGIIFADVTEDKSDAAVDVSGAVVDLNKRVEQATNGAVDLRFLFPLGLSFLAIRQLVAKGLQFETIPWYVLAWYAFDSFIKLHGVNQSNSTKE